MDDEQKQLKAVSRAQRARATLEDPSIIAAFDYLDGEYIRMWRECPTPDGRDRLWQASQVLMKVKEHLALAVRDGEVSKRILNQIEESRRRNAA
jgi:hypothetical protein